MSRRAVYFTSAQLRAITADKLRYGYFLLAVLSVLAVAVSLMLSAPDPTVDLQRDVLRARTVSVSVISHAVDTTADSRRAGIGSCQAANWKAALCFCVVDLQIVCMHCPLHMS